MPTFISTYLLEAIMLFCVVPVGASAVTYSSARLMQPGNPLGIRWLVITIFGGGGTLFVVTWFLLLARWFLVTRAFVRPRNRLLQLFRALDAMFQRMNRVTGNVVLVRDDQTLPDERPIAWREMYRRSLGTARYLFRVLTVIELPVVVVLVLSAGLSTGQPDSASSVMLYLVWIVALLLVTVTAVTAVGGERSAQTLPVLLATPLSGREILEQKMSGVYRLMVVLAIPFLTIFGFETYWQATLNTSFAVMRRGHDPEALPFSAVDRRDRHSGGLSSADGVVRDAGWSENKIPSPCDYGCADGGCPVGRAAVGCGNLVESRKRRRC